MIPGILYLNSKTTYGFTKSKVPLRKFKITMKGYKSENIYIATRKKMACNNVYGVVKKNKDNKYNLVCIIGNVGDPKAEEKFIKYYYQINHKKIQNYSQSDIDLTPNRIDLIHLNTFSIDPLDCEDIDDLLSINKLEKNIFEIGIHIADVSSYIEEGSELDNIIKDRCETVYMPNYRIDMLPVNYVNECSLNMGEEKRAFSILIKYDSYLNKVISISHTKSMIINKNKISYEEAEENMKSDNDLENLYNIGKLIYNKNDSSKDKDNYDMHKMVEIFMIMANTYVGNTIKNYKNAIIRTQDKFTNNFIDNDKFNDINKIMNKLNMERAKYVYSADSEHNNHFMLGIDNYTHFTSPIRRYADILTHRLLYWKETKYDNICDDLNLKHKNLVSAYRDLERLKRIYELKDINDIVDGYIININDNKIRVYIPNYNIEGYCKLFSNKIRHLISYSSDNNNISFNNGETKLSIGDTIRVKIVISVKTPVVKNKLMLQMIEPNLSNLTYRIFCNTNI